MTLTENSGNNLLESCNLSFVLSCVVDEVDVCLVCAADTAGVHLAVLNELTPNTATHTGAPIVQCVAYAPPQHFEFIASLCGVYRVQIVTVRESLMILYQDTLPKLQVNSTLPSLRL